MKTITFSQLRLRVANVLAPKFTDVYCELYKKCMVSYPEEQLAFEMAECKMETKNFLHEICSLNNEDSLNSLYQSKSDKLIRCFYMRYWIAINNIKELSVSESNTIAVPEDDVKMLEMILFDFIEDLSRYQQ